MYKVSRVSYFSAAHFLRNYKGKCENLHGHNWKVEATVSSSKLNELGMVIDFSELKKLIKEVLKELDHTCLNDLEYFRKNNPSSEEISRYIFNKLKPEISERNCSLEKVKVWETESSCAIYRE